MCSGIRRIATEDVCISCVYSLNAYGKCAVNVSTLLCIVGTELVMSEYDASDPSYMLTYFEKPVNVSSLRSNGDESLVVTGW